MSYTTTTEKRGEEMTIVWVSQTDVGSVDHIHGFMISSIGSYVVECLFLFLDLWLSCHDVNFLAQTIQRS
jgi:hypothetical protein